MTPGEDQTPARAVMAAGAGMGRAGGETGSALDAVGIYSQGAGRRGWGPSVDGK